LPKESLKKTGCPVLTDDKNENSKWWPVLYIGRYATKDEQGSYIWKLRDELSAASQKIVRDTRLSRQEINAAFKEARRRLTDAK
jgi:hypothetical protein